MPGVLVPGLLGQLAEPRDCRVALLVTGEVAADRAAQEFGAGIGIGTEWSATAAERW